MHRGITICLLPSQISAMECLRHLVAVGDRSSASPNSRSIITVLAELDVMLIISARCRGHSWYDDDTKQKHLSSTNRKK